MSSVAWEQSVSRPPADDDDVAQFDRWSGRYERSKWQWLHFDRVHRHAFKLAAPFGEPAAVLDVGSGTGRLLRAAHARWPNARLVGVDPSEGMVAAGRIGPVVESYRAEGEVDRPIRKGDRFRARDV